MKTLIAVFTCPKYAERRKAVTDTWLTLVPSDAVFADDPCTYTELPQKTYRTVRYAVDQGYDTLIKADDDTFLMPLPAYLAEFTEHDCLCHVRPSKNGNPAYPQGGCYGLSRRAMLAVLAHPELFTVGPEDLAVGQALAAEGIALQHTERIKPTVVFGHPATWNNIIAGHCCPPREMRRLFEANIGRIDNTVYA